MKHLFERTYAYHGLSLIFAALATFVLSITALASCAAIPTHETPVPGTGVSAATYDKVPIQKCSKNSRCPFWWVADWNR